MRSFTTRLALAVAGVTLVVPATAGHAAPVSPVPVPVNQFVGVGTGANYRYVPDYITITATTEVTFRNLDATGHTLNLSWGGSVTASAFGSVDLGMTSLGASAGVIGTNGCPNGTYSAKDASVLVTAVVCIQVT
jgi:plastocyanin